MELSQIDIKKHFAKFDIDIKFLQKNEFQKNELFFLFELPKNFNPFENFTDKENFKKSIRNIYIKNEFLDYCLNGSKIEFFNFEYYEF